MKRRSVKVVLSPEERERAERFVSTGANKAMLIRRANILLALDESTGVVNTQAKIAAMFNCTTQTVYKIAKQYNEDGIERILVRKVRETPPVPSKITGEVEARIIQLACSTPPEGRRKWTLRLLGQKAVELEIIESISYNTVHQLLKKRLKTTFKEEMVYSVK